ncbi:MAG TPA: FkbM family methyltransferase [Chitinophagaceae bacterium]|nr:FkbM family methyltransferase [Chitinophagaceae bacterium]
MLLSKTSFQPLMQKLYFLGLTGMNYGNANALDYNHTGEVAALAYIKTKLEGQKPLAVFDVGANEGHYALLLQDAFRDHEPAIYAFEPIKRSFSTLVQNTAMATGVHPVNCGLGAREETATIFANYEGSGATTFYRDAILGYRSNKNFSEEIQLTTLDLFCEKNAIDNIGFLKIDVEGHELPVLRGANNLVGAGKIKFIQFEFGPFHVYSRTFFKDFWDLLSPAYTLYRVIRDGLFKIEKYSESLEIFRTANFLAERKDLTL